MVYRYRPLRYSDYPPRSELWAKGREVRSYASFFARALWFCPLAVRDPRFPEEYVDDSWMLPGALSFDVVPTADWKKHVAVAPILSYQRCGESLKQEHAEHVRLVYDRVGVYRYSPGVPCDLNLDTWAFRKDVEVTIGQRNKEL